MKTKSAGHIGICVTIICLFIFAAYALTYEVLLWNVKQSLHAYNTHIQSLIAVSNGKWDMSRYNADTLTPHPQGSSGYLKPLYVITRQGFVIERTNPIGGYLDSADSGSILALKTPATIQSVTGENWRVLATPVKKRGQVEGVIFVAQFMNDLSNIESIDDTLSTNSAYIASRIKITDDTIDAAGVDISHINFDVTFEIVSRDNKVVRNNGRVPTTIDVSHLADELRKPPSRIEIRNSDNQRFVVDREAVWDKNGTVAGIIVTSQSLDELYRYLNTQLAVSLILLGAASCVYVGLQRRYARKKSAPFATGDITFHASRSTLQVGQKQFNFPYASNQYYVLDAICKNPTRRWEQDELLEKIGSTELSATRAIYDAMLAINRKCAFKLIIYQDKTYFCNPQISQTVAYKK